MDYNIPWYKALNKPDHPVSLHSSLPEGHKLIKDQGFFLLQNNHSFATPGLQHSECWLPQDRFFPRQFNNSTILSSRVEISRSTRPNPANRASAVAIAAMAAVAAIAVAIAGRGGMGGHGPVFTANRAVHRALIAVHPSRALRSAQIRKKGPRRIAEGRSSEESG